MKIIALQGKRNKGKSETLNIVYQFMLLFGYTQVPGHFRELGNPIQKDFTDILEKKGMRIGIATLGDYDDYKSDSDALPGDIIQDLITHLQSHGCKKVICACNIKLAKAIAFIKSYQHHFVKKTETSVKSEQRIRNGEDAEIIYKLV